MAATNVAALEDREPESPALRRYARLGRLLARLPASVPDAEARSSLVSTLRDWTLRLRVPGLATYGLAEDSIAAVVADARGSSMRTNPIVLTDEELAAVLRASL